MAAYMENSKEGKPNYQRLMHALGPRVRLLWTDSNSLLEHAHHLSSLETLCFMPSRIHVSSPPLSGVRKHPTLQTVKLHSCGTVSDDLRDSACTWSRIYLVGKSFPAVLSQLPLTGLQKLCLQGRITVLDTYDYQGLLLVLDRYQHKLTLLPEWDAGLGRLCFKCKNVFKSTTPLVKALRSDCCLVVKSDLSRMRDLRRIALADGDGVLGDHAVDHAYYESEDQLFLSALWAALHPSVSSVRLHIKGDIDWCNFWSGIPKSIRCVELCSPDFYPDESQFTLRGKQHTCEPRMDALALCCLVAGTPQHVTRLTFFGVEGNQHTRWEAAGMRTAAPEHLHLQFDGTC